ncbi:exodeoxyribonuclease V subunit alpha [Shewanella halotolerans]|uniref:exodeoxyribonuclease V subunit alpha n=1 Tax=Shewanella halotolerans TaxID=2864204 RepID=UPI001C659CB9|nr:exodeoxyribonuclease V subunit alpha [Shewanella halotolerans]QYJ91684.1 exodeoxyribonuclease V subunit alpha [Shewanella halotolerans]
MIQLAQPLSQLLKHWQQEGLLTPLDRHFALQMQALHSDGDDLFTLICALLSRQLSQQHTCLPLTQIDRNNPLHEQLPQCQLELTPQALAEQLTQYQAVSPADGELNTPLILDGDRLYLQRYYQFETQVAERLTRLNQPIRVAAPDKVASILNILFAGQAEKPDWQRVATATAFSQKLAVITGGPGTGKTTTVTKLLLLLCLEQQLTIKLVAPTGKAAARLSESIKTSKARLAQELAPYGDELDLEQLKQVPEEAATLHRLLGVIPGSHRFRHHKDNPLRLDLLILDEASMVDLPMMHKLLAALPEHARLILLGDQDQLASVEAGAVLADICAGLKQAEAQSIGSLNIGSQNIDNQQANGWRMRYSKAKAALLSQLTNEDLSAFIDTRPALGDSLAMLMHSHRFKGDAGIGQLAGAVNRRDLAEILSVWQKGYDELSWLEHQLTPQGNAGLTALMAQSVDKYRSYLTLVNRLANKAPAGEVNGQLDEKLAAEAAQHLDLDEIANQIITRFNDFRILCAMRAGEYGVEGINGAVTQALKDAQLIQPSSEFYAGRPIIIQSNDYNLGLFNGDIGVILPGHGPSHRLMAYFVQADGSLLKVLPARLPSHETCYAMTVHKSQGSEFQQVAFVLPPRPSVAQRQLLTKELVYTAITRAKGHFSCLGSQAVFEAACCQATLRASGLAHRLWPA